MSTGHRIGGRLAISSDVAEIKAGVRNLRDKFDDLEESLAAAKIWGLFLDIALAGVNLGALARGLGGGRL